mmetsp:Transcript_124934/g.400213  ORF Transcript_124934/g.400213 Transcript_124934/m.400213 type:complete len:203 (+) Transcript_124934:859-1467(+)
MIDDIERGQAMHELGITFHLLQQIDEHAAISEGDFDAILRPPDLRQRDLLQSDTRTLRTLSRALQVPCATASRHHHQCILLLAELPGPPGGTHPFPDGWFIMEKRTDSTTIELSALLRDQVAEHPHDVLLIRASLHMPLAATRRNNLKLITRLAKLPRSARCLDGWVSTAQEADFASFKLWALLFDHAEEHFRGACRRGVVK